MEQLQAFRMNMHPLAVVHTEMTELDLLDREGDDKSHEANQLKAISLAAKLPTIVAALFRLEKGLEPVSPRPEYSHAENFVYMLHGKEPDETAVKAIDKALILHADHELNASTFASRV